MFASSPDADVVIRSTGIGASPYFARKSATDLVTRWISVWLFVARFEPAEAIPSYPLLPAADSRPVKYFGSENAWPMRLDPTAVPSSRTMSEPFACDGKATWPTAHTATG